MTDTVISIPMLGSAIQTVSMTPVMYRLMQKQDGSLMLQGAYEWADGYIRGYTWKDVETVKEGDNNDTN